MNNLLKRFPLLYGLIFGTIVFYSVYIPTTKWVGPESIKIVGQSMFPALRDGGKCIFYTKFKEINRGDIVALYCSGDFLCKRIIGLPGDEIIIVGDNIIINGNKYFEYYITQEWGHPTPILYHVPHNQYFVLGDNRNISFDSRSFGFVPREHILAKYLWNWSW